MQIKHTLFLTSVLLAASGMTRAQAPPTPATPPAQTAPPSPDRANGCAPTQSTPQGNIVPKGMTTGQSREPLGDQLAKSDGVLCPPSEIGRAHV